MRVEEWGFDGKRPKSRISLLKDGHVLSMNYDLKSDMDLRKEKQLEEEHLKTIAETVCYVFYHFFVEICY